MLKSLPPSQQTTQLIKRLQCHALSIPDDAGNVVDLDNGRLRAIEILLRKVLPDLSADAGTREDAEEG